MCGLSFQKHSHRHHNLQLPVLCPSRIIIIGAFLCDVSASRGYLQTTTLRPAFLTRDQRVDSHTISSKQTEDSYLRTSFLYNRNRFNRCIRQGSIGFTTFPRVLPNQVPTATLKPLLDSYHVRLQVEKGGRTIRVSS